MCLFNLNIVGLKAYILRAILESLLEVIFLNLNSKAQFGLKLFILHAEFQQ